METKTTVIIILICIIVGLILNTIFCSVGAGEAGSISSPDEYSESAYKWLKWCAIGSGISAFLILILTLTYAFWDPLKSVLHQLTEPDKKKE